jgi:hypothetical protein
LYAHSLHHILPSSIHLPLLLFDGVSKSFRTGRLERELQMVQLSATRCSCIAILWAILVSFAAITLFVASQWVFIVVILYFVIDSVRKLLDTTSYISLNSVLLLFSHSWRVLPSSLCTSDSHAENCYAYASALPSVLHTPPISSSLILSARSRIIDTLSHVGSEILSMQSSERSWCGWDVSRWPGVDTAGVLCM